MIRGSLLALAVVAGLVLAGCGSAGSTADHAAGRVGDPATVAPPTSAAPSSRPSAQQALPGLPPRPRTISLQGVNPCSLLTKQQRAKYGFPGDVQPGTQLNVGPACAFTAEDVEGAGPSRIRFVISLANGVGMWFDGPGGPQVRPIMVAGFPAVEIRRTAYTPPGCSVAVDVADGQQLGAQYSGLLDDESLTLDQKCKRATMFAAEAMQTLLARTGPADQGTG